MLLVSLGRRMRTSRLTLENSTIPANMRNYAYTGTLRPVYPLSEKRVVPANIVRPDYADDRACFVCMIVQCD